jgi:organic hydroperoxide reductase OsmC/OhrA
MHPFPHHYAITSSARPDGSVALTSAGAGTLESAPPKEFGGPGNQWSPEGLLTAAVADCFVLNFKAIAAASKYPWVSLEARTEGTLSRTDGKMHFTRFETRAKLAVPPGTDLERGKKLMEKAEQTCPIANSLTSERHLVAEVTA